MREQLLMLCTSLLILNGRINSNKRWCKNQENYNHRSCSTIELQVTHDIITLLWNKTLLIILYIIIIIARRLLLQYVRGDV